jgi:hypothetical protein
MLFPTIDFAVFFVIVFTGSWMLRPYAKAWRWFLLLASCVFYLDPFNPVATDGQGLAHVNVVIALCIAGAALATTGILKAGFGTVGGPDAVPGGLRTRAGGRRAAGDDDLGDPDAYDDEPPDGSLLTDTDEPPPFRVNPASIWAPLAVGVLLLAGNFFRRGGSWSCSSASRSSTRPSPRPRSPRWAPPASAPR